jgi:alpha-1,2-mannosyltransferase
VVIFGVLSVIALVWLVGTATFMFNVKDTRFVLGDRFSIGVSHNCLTAYITAAYLASTEVDNIYSPLHFHSASPSSTPIHKELQGIFRIDEYLYPPQFLSLPYALLVVFKNFFTIRAAWFVMTVGVVIAALAGAAWWCGAFRSQPRLLLFPLVLCAPNVYTTLQISNVHILIIAISILAMMAFDKHHSLAGGALLGFVTVTKIGRLS